MNSRQYNMGVKTNRTCCVVFLCIVCLRPVFCVPSVVSVCGMSILDCPFGFLQSLFYITTRNEKRTYSLRCSGRVNINRLGYCPLQSFCFPVLSPFMTFHLVCNQITRQVPLVEQFSSPRFLVGFVLIDLQFYVYILQIVVCPFVLFLLATVLSVLLRFTDSEYPFGIFKLFFLPYYKCKATSIIVNAYTTPIATKIVNYKHVLQDLSG